MAEPGTYLAADGTGVALRDAKRRWSEAARPVLQAVAATYHATIRYADLAEDIQVATGVRTRMLMHYWIGEVLGAVSRECRKRGEPLLSALCVDASGSVGPGYGGLIDELGGAVPDDLDRHAAQERLACYRFFGAAMPADGGRPALTPQLAAKRGRAARHAQDLKPRKTCQTCFITLPLNGVCGTCS